MRHLMHALVAVCLVAPATVRAELQWQTSGVRPASHQEVAPRPKRSRPVAKRPTVVRQAAAAPVAKATPVQRAVLTTPTAPPAPSAPSHAAHLEPVGESYPVEGHGEYVVEGDFYGAPGCACAGEPTCEFGCAGACGEEVCGCGDVCNGACGGVPVTFLIPPIRELTAEAGVQAFKNPLDDGRDRGNFGGNVGVNLGGSMSLLGTPALGYQIGYRATFNQLHGDTQFGGGTADGHTQSFFTAGLFRRRAVGLQYGVVYDLLRDERQQSADFGQLRGLVSVTNPRGHEIGFQFATGLSDNNLGGTTFHTTDQYLGFYRMHANHGGEFRVFGGFDDNSKGILGGDVSLPLTDRWSLTTGFTYVVPEEDPGADEESWNLGMGLTWHYGCRARQSFKSQYRPLFRVADNGSLIIDDE